MDNIMTNSGCQSADTVTWLAKDHGLHRTERRRKYYAEELALIYTYISTLRDRAWKVRACGDYLTFGVTAEGERRLMGANYCLERLCPQCMHRRTVRIWGQISRVLDWMDKLCDDAHQPRYRYLLLTLTVKNIEGPELKGQMDRLMHAWGKLTRRKEWQKVIKGYFRGLEITYNHDSRTYHPHYHAILAVRPDYFAKNYIRQSKWVDLWRSCLGVDYDPIVDVRTVKPDEKGSINGAVAEVAKYTVKGSDYIHRDLEKAAPIVETLWAAMFGRRLFFFGGCMADARRALRLGDAENDLTDAEETALRWECIVAIEQYKWVFGAHGWDWLKCATDDVNGGRGI